MSINHLLTSSELLDISVKTLSVNGSKVGLSSVNIDTSTSTLDCEGVNNVYLDTGSGAIIDGVVNCSSGQMIHFMATQQASSLTIRQGANLRTVGGADIVLAGTGSSAVGTWSDSLGYLTVCKTSA